MTVADISTWIYVLVRLHKFITSTQFNQWTVRIRRTFSIRIPHRGGRPAFWQISMPNAMVNCRPTHRNKIVGSFIHSFIHSIIQAIFIAPIQVHYYSDALPTQATTRILFRSFTPKRQMQLRVKDLPNVPTWQLERDSSPRLFGWKATNLPMSHHTPQVVGVAPLTTEHFRSSSDRHEL